MKYTYLFLLSIIWTIDLNGQSPEKISYQAVIRDAGDKLVTNSVVGMQISIFKVQEEGLKSTKEYEVSFSETHTPTTNANGLVSIEIGNGTIITGSFAAIDWANGEYFIKTETDPAGGTDYTITSESQLLSVPYALHAKTAESADENDPVFSVSAAVGISGTDIENWNNKLSTEIDGDISNELQVLSISNDTIFLSSGGFVKLPAFPYSTSFNDLTDLPANIDTDSTNDFSGDYNALSNKPTLWDSTYNSIKNTPDLSIYATKDMGNQTITNLADPVNNQDAATKAYADILSRQIFDLEYAIGNDSISDIDGNFYKIVKIGKQYWMTENLRTSTYNDGTPIPKVTDNAAWAGLATGAYCWYSNDSATYEIPYGKLYNWHAVNTGNLCPTGWHVPTDSEWTILTDYLGGESGAGGKLKEIGTGHWNSPNTNATNETGFSALPAGYRYYADGTFWGIGEYGYWWSSTELSAPIAWGRVVSYNAANVVRGNYYKQNGLSIRCVHD